MLSSDKRYQAYVNILREELVPAMGCTEPIAIAYAAAKHAISSIANRNRLWLRQAETLLKT